MHLIGAQLLQCDCFHSGRVAMTGPRALGVKSWDVPPKLKASLRVHMEYDGDDLNGSALLPLIRDFLHDSVPSGNEAPGQSYLCAHPISLHKLRGGSEYMPLWHALEVRDAANERALDKWRQQHRPNVAPAATLQDLLEAARG